MVSRIGSLSGVAVSGASGRMRLSSVPRVQSSVTLTKPRGSFAVQDSSIVEPRRTSPAAGVAVRLMSGPSPRNNTRASESRSTWPRSLTAGASEAGPSSRSSSATIRTAPVASTPW